MRVIETARAAVAASHAGTNTIGNGHAWRGLALDLMREKSRRGEAAERRSLIASCDFIAGVLDFRGVV